MQDFLAGDDESPTMFDEEDATTMSRDTRIEALLKEWNLSFELVDQFPVSKVRFELAAQIRAEAHIAPKSMVDEYVTHMKHGAVFPPIVVSDKGVLVDGNTRLEAARRNGIKSFPAYKVKFGHLGQAKMLGAALNQMGGDRLTDDEIVLAAEAMMDERYPDDVIARHLGRSVSHVYNVRKDRTYRQVAERTGMTHIELPKAVQRLLAGIHHDEPFKATVEAVAQAKPALKDVSTLVKKIEATRSDADALATIDATVQDWGPVTGPPAGKGKSLSRSKDKKALALAKTLVALTDDPAELVMEHANDATGIWQKLNTLTTNVLALYQRQVM